MLTDFTGETALDIEERPQLSSLVIELQGLLEARSEIETGEYSGKNRALRALWLDRVAEIDSRFNLEWLIDQILAADQNHANSDLFNRIFDLLDVLREDHSIE